nr:helix-turn-helix transcriptional regulator [Methylobacterium brachythecii]
MNVLNDTLLGEIYEAAHIPELWPGLLDKLTAESDAWGGMLFTVSAGVTRWIASEATTPFFAQFLANGWMARNPLVERGVKRDHAGFLTDLDLFTPAELEAEPMYQDMRRLGGGQHVGTAINVPNGDTLVINIERRSGQSPFSRGDAERLDPYRPHLARAAMLAARYTQQRFENTVSDLELLGLASAAIGAQGAIIACNRRFEAMMPSLFKDGRGRLSIEDPVAQKVVFDLIDKSNASARPESVSIPIRAAGSDARAVLHMVPITGHARDVFTRAAHLLVVTPIGIERKLDLALVQGLFDLTPAEARTAGSIAQGLSVPETASQLGIAVNTVRAQLRAVFDKSGVGSQSELAALLSGVKSPG